MKNKLSFILLFAALFGSAAAAEETGTAIKYGGYLAGEFLKGQSQSEFANGSFKNLQAGFLLSGRLSTSVAFGAEVRSRSGSDFEVEQAWVGYVPSQVFSLKAGLYLVPFGLWNEASRPHESLLIGTPLNLEYFYPEGWRDMGVLVEGRIGFLSYAAYVGNGLKLADADELKAGQQWSDNNKDKGKGGRLGINFGQEIQAGVSYYDGKYDDLNLYRLKLEGTHFSWATANWELKAEATKGIIANPAGYDDGKCEGYAIWTVMKFKMIQPVGSYQRVKYTDPFHGGGIDIERHRWTAGVRCVFESHLFLKAEYEWNGETPKVKDNVIRIQAALSF